MLDKIFGIVETIALNGPDQVGQCRVGVVGEAPDLSCASVRSASKQHPAVQHKDCDQKEKSKQKCRIIWMDLESP